MKTRLLFLLAVLSISLQAQNSSTFLDSSRAIDWSKAAGFTIPNYTAPCATQPTLTANSSSAASANASSIQSALASCDATHNVVNLPAGNYYVTGISFANQGYQVLRGAGPNSTTLTPTAAAGCSGESAGICMSSSAVIYDGNTAAIPPSGKQQCSWSAGYAESSTSITLSNCGGTPPLNKLLVLDQANDSTDNGGEYICDSSVSTCTYNGSSSGNHDSRVINGIPHSQQQVVYITGVTSLGSNSYTITISPGVYFSNIRSSQSPGAWWPGTVQNDGLENMTVNGASLSLYNIAFYGCYQCWVKNVRTLDSARAHVVDYLSLDDVVRDGYFYLAQSNGSESYGVEVEESSGLLIENNIFQQTTAPILFGQGSGNVIDYNFSIDNQFPNNYVDPSYAAHNAGNEMNLWEGNSFVGIWADDAWGASAQQTYYRNMLVGWAKGRTNSTFPVMMRSFNRAFNLVGNVIGQPGYHTTYQSYATSATGGISSSAENKSIYSLGWAGTGATCGTPSCDPLVYSTLMRWGNYDTVNASIQWNSTEASPAGAAYFNANFSSGYFSSLSHSLPPSLYYQSAPSWWPSTIAWPAIGPDVTTGNVGECSGGTYPGTQAISSGQCTGGSLTTAWASHVNAIPAQACFLNTMGGPPDGSGSMLNFDADTCYNSGSSPSKPGSPTGLTGSAVPSN